jgi:NAD(P)-dependent dehydrogenase (short-subunit alcohol dehydrogenase family)
MIIESTIIYATGFSSASLPPTHSWTCYSACTLIFLCCSSTKCLVTGASSGIGKATCEVLTGYGATVIGSGRNQASLEELKSQGSIADFVVADITQDGECEKLVTKTVELLLLNDNDDDDDDDDDGSSSSLTTIVIAHGGLRGGAVGDGATTLENYQFNMKLNTQAPFELIQHAVPYLKKNSSSSIVTVSSVNGKQSFAACASYCMSKAAVDQLTRCASIDLAKFGIRVNAVNPGVIKTNLHKVGTVCMLGAFWLTSIIVATMRYTHQPFHDSDILSPHNVILCLLLCYTIIMFHSSIVLSFTQQTAGMDDEAYEGFLKRSIDITHPLSTSLGRVGEPSEVAELIAFLVSDKAKFLTGECIAIDGGRQNLGAR